jgi:hypothetical protein
MENNNFVGFPNINFTEEDVITRPMPLHELPIQARIDQEMAVVNQHHQRIVKSIGVFWGHSDCLEYLQKLILSGGDGHGHARVGFRAEVLTALINLANLHEEDFPDIKPRRKADPGFF